MLVAMVMGGEASWSGTDPASVGPLTAVVEVYLLLRLMAWEHEQGRCRLSEPHPGHCPHPKAHSEFC